MEQVMTSEQTNRALQRKRRNEKLKKIFANVFVYFILLLMYAPLIPRPSLIPSRRRLPGR